MRVVQVSCHRDPLRRGGAELLETWTALPLAARAAADAGCDVTVVHAAWRDEEITRDGVRYRFVAEPELPPRVSRRLQPRLVAAVRALHPRVVHLQGMGMPQARWLCGNGAAVVVQDHSEPPKTGWRGAVQRWALARVDGVLFTAREQAEPFFAAGALRAETPVFEVLESTTAFTPGDREAARRETGIGGDPCLLWLGHLDANKDPLTVLEAVARVRERLPALRLWMCYGTAPLEAAVRARLAAEPELAARVALLGPVPHARVEQLCRAADLFVQGSRRESCGYAVLESLACGATPLVTDIPAFRRLTRGGAVGGLFAPGDADGLARLILAFAARSQAELRARATAHFAAHLSPAALARELGAAYAAVAGRRP
ncbi:MAG TPA: glycosyltransferase family 4 protein [Longimicrobium sp.]